MAKRFGYTFADWAEDHALSTIVWLLACLAGFFAGQSLHAHDALWTLGYFTLWTWLNFWFDRFYWGNNPIWKGALLFFPAYGYFVLPYLKVWLASYSS